jgi:hypothetical protein
MAIFLRHKQGQQVSPNRCSHLPNEMATAVFTNRREKSKNSISFID